MQYTLLHKSRSLLWWLAPSMGTVIGNTIYMPDRWYTLPEPGRTAWLRHEEVHVTQRLSWLRYLTSVAYRREVELEAYEAQVRYLVTHGSRIDVDSWAGVMSEGYGCLSWITREEARVIIQQWLSS